MNGTRALVGRYDYCVTCKEFREAVVESECRDCSREIYLAEKKEREKNEPKI